MGTYFPLLIWQGMELGVGGPSFQRGKQNYPVFFFFFRQGFLGAPAAAVGSQNKQQFPLLAPQGGSEFAFYTG